MDSLVEKFKNNLEVCNIKKGQTIILGVSGGIDSVVMLDLFLKTKKEMKFKLVVAHLNHGVRKESDIDEQFVKELANKNKLTFISKKIIPPKSGNLEEMLRNERKDFLGYSRESFNADFIALAHNKNDQAETLFLNLVRGSGPAGLSAMDMTEGNIIRPLLNISRNEIEKYSKNNKLKWHEDKTNKDTKYSRNLLRLKILPELSKINPEWLENIYRTTQIQNDIDNFFKKEANKVIGGQKSINIKNLNRLEKVLLFEVFATLYERAKGNRKELSLKNLENLETLVQKTNGTKRIDLPGNITAIRGYDKLDFLPKKEDNRIPVLLEPVSLKIGENRFNDWVITASKVIEQKNPSKETIYIELDDLKELEIRTKKSGDKIKIEGVGTKKLQDVFVNSKVEPKKRDLWPIIFNKKTSDILWIPGLESTRKKTGKREIIKLTARKY